MLGYGFFRVGYGSSFLRVKYGSAFSVGQIRLIVEGRIRLILEGSIKFESDQIFHLVESGSGILLG